VYIANNATANAKRATSGLRIMNNASATSVYQSIKVRFLLYSIVV